jgi:hypothetical protein
MVAQMRGDDKEDRYLFEYGEKVIPIVVHRRYFNIPDLRRPNKETIRSLLLVIDYKDGQPFPIENENDESRVTISYVAYAVNIIEEFNNTDQLNYYSGYSIKDKYLELERRTLPFNPEIVQSGQDLSFLLLHRSDDNSQYDMMIECQQANAQSPQGPCKMDVRLPNNVFAQAHFHRNRLPHWSNIMESVKRLSGQIGIDKEPR